MYSESSKQSDNDENTKRDPTDSLPMTISSFENLACKNKSAYLDMLTIFEKRDIHRRNHVEFIYAALRNMKDFGVHTDIEVYKALINVMPKGKFIATNIFQSEFMHYPKQQQCIIDLLEQMEDNGVIPDYEMEAMLLNVFGRKGHPLRKYWRMMYWMPKFKNLSPWLLPNPVPNDVLELARLAVERMCTVDLQSEILVIQAKDVKDSIDHTWIVSGMSPEQSELLKKHDKTKPLYIEGPYLIWLRNKSVNYFTLRADADPNMKFDVEHIDTDDVKNIKIPFFGAPPVEKRVALKRSVHQQDDGTIFSICATGTSSKDSLLSWIRYLEKNGNPELSSIPILFKFKSSTGSQIIPLTKDVR